MTETTIDMFVDGSCINNGKPGARAAYAWVKAIDGCIVDTYVCRLRDEEPQTNQYAELRAFQEAFAHIDAQTHVTIYSDSAYAINCITTWGPQWKKNGWKRKASGSGGKPLEHLHVICQLVDFWEENATRLCIKHIPAHQTAALSKTYPYSGNAHADRLAREKAEET